MRKSSRKSAKVFHEKDAMLISEKVWVLKQLVVSWWEEKVDLTPCNGATPSESRIREIRTYGSMRGRRSKDLLLLCDVAIFRDGWWWVSNAAHTGTAYKFKYGISSDIPVVGDINNDGSDDVAIYRNGWWWVSNAAHTGTAYKFKYGIAGDKPVVGDI